MSVLSITLSPISNSAAWHTFSLGGVTSPGTIPRNGIKGFKRETGWDKKLGKGTQGATLTLKTIPPVEGTISMQLFTDKDFSDWDDFVANVLSISPAKQKVKGLPIFYPAFTSINLKSVVIKHYTPPEHMGKGLYMVTVELLEWQQPPKQTIVQTISGTVNIPTITITGLDPEVARLEEQLKALNQASKP